MSLGFINPAQNHSVRKTEKVVVDVGPMETEAPSRTVLCTCSVPFMKSTLFGGLFLAASFLFFEEGLTADYRDRDPRIGTIVIAAVGGFICLLLNDVSVAFNTFLGYYLGIEIFLIKHCFEVARLSSSSEELTGGAWAFGFVILVHLLPFLLINKSMFLILLAYVGLIVNVITILYIVSPTDDLHFHLLLYGASGAALIVSTIGKTSLSYRQLLQNAVTGMLRMM